MEPFLTEQFANPSGMHAAARASKSALECAREVVARACGCEPREVVFTGGGSEADNLAVKGAAWAARDERGADGVVTSAIEHKAVLGACGRLEREGFRVQRFVEMVRARAPRAVIHTDAVQGLAWLDLGVATAGADLVAISGHKFGGPKGVGALVVRSGTALVPLIEGGGHEGELRAGTQNVAGIVGLAAAAEFSHRERAGASARIGGLRDQLQAGLMRAIPALAVNGDPARRVAGILNCAFPGIEAESLLVVLDQQGVYAPSGSACASGAIDPSHVLLAMGISPDLARSSVRFSLGHTTASADIDAALAAVSAAVRQLTGAAA